MVLRKFMVMLVLTIPSVAMAQDAWKAYNFFNLVGGLNDGFDPTALAENEASDLQNIVFTTGGAIKKRQGFAYVNTSALSATAIFTGLDLFKLSSGTRALVALVSDGATDRIYKMDYGAGTSGPDGTWDNISGALSLSFGTDNQADFASALDVLVIEDGVNTTAPDQWAGSGNATDLTNAPNSTMVEYHKNHLFAAGNSSQLSQMAFSNICTTLSTCLTTWTSTDVFNVETNDGQIIRAIKSGLDALYIWKESSIWRVSGNNRDNFVLEQMVQGLGTCSNQSVVVINNKFVFMTCQGDIALYDGGLNVQIISTKIEGTLTAMNQDRFDQAVAVAFDDGTGDEDYYVSITSSGGSTHDRVLVFDTFHTAWTKFTGITANAMTVYELGTLQPALLLGNYAGQAARYPTTTADAGAAISAFYQSGQIQFDIPHEKIFRLAQIFVNQEGNYNLTFEYRLDFEGSGTSTSINLAGSGALWDSAIFDTSTYGDLNTTTGRVEGFRTCDFFQWRVSNLNASQPFTVKGVRLWMEPTGRVGGIVRFFNWLDQWIMPEASAGELPSPPPLRDEPVTEQQYLQRIYQEHNNLTVVTVNPNGSRRADFGDLVGYNDGVDFNICINTSQNTSGIGGTSWECLPAVAPGAGSGTVTQVDTGTGLTGGPITTTGTISLVTPVTVPNGGTGVATLTANGVLFGNAGAAIQATSQGGSNTVLTANVGSPSFSSSPTVTNITVTSTVTGAIVDISTSGIRLSALDCSTKSNGGTLTTSSDGLVRCEDDDEAANREFYWSASALQPLEHTSDSIAPIVKDLGVNVDLLVRGFDDSTDECAGGTFLVPSEMVTGAVVTFRTKWYDSTASACGASCEVMWDIRTIARDHAQNWDTILTTTAATASTASTTQDVLTETTWTGTSGTLGMDASDTVEFEVCRDANNASDDLVGDANMVDFSIEIPIQ